MIVSINLPISRLKLSARAKTVCAQNDVETLGDLFCLSESDISNFHLCGMKTTAELTSIRSTLMNVCCDFEVPLVAENEVFNHVSSTFSRVFNSCVSGMKNDERAFILGEFAGPELLLRALIHADSIKDEVLQVLNFSELLNSSYVYTVLVLFETLAQIEEMPEGVLKIMHMATDRIKGGCSEHNRFFALNSVAENLQICLRALYEMEFNKLSVRARNCLGTIIPSLDEAMPYIFGYKTIKAGNISAMGAKTIDEVGTFLNSLKALIGKVVSDANRDDASLVDYMKLSVRARYPFLTYEEAELPALSELLGEPLPVFYLMERYVLHCTVGNGVYFRKYYGFGTNRKHRDSHAAKQIAEQVGCVPYNVTFAASRFVPYTEIMKEAAMSVVAEVRRPVVPSYDKQLIRIIADNSLTCTPYQLMAIISAVNPNYKILDSPEADVCYLVRYDLLRDFHLSKVKRILSSFVNRNIQKDTCLSLRKIVEEAEPGAKWRDELAELFIYFKDYYRADDHVKFVDCDTIHLYANRVNLKQACEQILRECGHVMSRKEIFSEFRRRYPDSSVKNVTLCAALTANANIVAVGKSGRYGLQGFKNLFDGNIDDCIEMVLREQGSPMTVKDIFKRVRRYFPATTQRSISTYLSTCRERFVALVHGTYCMADSVGVTTVAKTLRTRRPFDVRFAALRAFVERNHRLPHYAAGDYEERSLYLWLRNLKYRRVGSTPEQRAQLSDFLACSNLLESGNIGPFEQELRLGNNVIA